MRSLIFMLVVVGSLTLGAAFAPVCMPLRYSSPGARLACLPHALPHVARRHTAALRMQEDNGETPPGADIYFSLKQRLQKANVWLVGMDGCDKEVIAQELASKLGYKYMNTNEIIASLLKSPIETAMTTLGEDEFNKIETAVLDQVQAYYGTVVSTGSIAPVFPENWSKFRTGLVAYCKVPHEGLKNQGLQDALSSEAPLLSGMPDESRLELLLAQREIKYSQADVTVSLTGKEDLEAKLIAVADSLRVFILENPANDKPVLGEAHARAISRVMGMGTKENEGRDADVEKARQKEKDAVSQEKIDALNALLQSDEPEEPKYQQYKD